MKKVPAFIFFLLLFFKGLLGEEANILSNIRQLTFEEKRSGEGYFGPNGNLRVFQSEREPKTPQTEIVRAGLRAYLGTIPDYGESAVPGLKLSGVTKGAPADKAGMKAGDIIIELAGRKIENIYDYTYAIDAVKIGQSVRIVVIRKSKKIELEIIPGSRE